jgi:hypothetical protein
VDLLWQTFVGTFFYMLNSNWSLKYSREFVIYLSNKNCILGLSGSFSSEAINLINPYIWGREKVFCLSMSSNSMVHISQGKQAKKTIHFSFRMNSH